jgi:hypothetical protein
MSVDIKIINPLNIENWDKLILSKKYYSFFHSSMWAKVLSESYNYIPKYVTTVNNNKFDVLIPIMEISSIITGRRGVSLPFTDYCDPIIKKEIPFENVLESLIQFGKKAKWNYLEFRDGNNIFPEEYHQSFFYGHTLELINDENLVFSSFNSNTKRNIKRAVREGVNIEICNTFQSIKSFYRLHCLTRKRHGLPPQPFNFFIKIYDYIISKRHGFIVLANIESKIVGAAVFFHFGNKALFKYGASDLIYQRFRPNHLIMWEAIKRYIYNGYRYFCFGRTKPNNDGLRRFKSGWGTDEKEYKYYRYNLKKNIFEKESITLYSLSTNFFKVMPIPLSKAVGSILYKHIG